MSTRRHLAARSSTSLRYPLLAALVAASGCGVATIDNANLLAAGDEDTSGSEFIPPGDDSPGDDRGSPGDVMTGGDDALQPADEDQPNSGDTSGDDALQPADEDQPNGGDTNGTAEDSPPALGAADWRIVDIVEDPNYPNRFTGVIEMAETGPAAAAVAVFWSDWTSQYQEVPFPTMSLGNRRWQMVAFSGQTYHVRAPGETLNNIAVRYALDPEGPTSVNSLDRKEFTVPIAEEDPSVYATVSTMAELQEAMIAAPGGAIIEVTGGPIVGKMAYATPQTKSPPITVRPQNRNNPPIFVGPADPDWAAPFDLTQWNGLIFDGLHFVNSKRDWRNGPNKREDVDLTKTDETGGRWVPFGVRLISTSNVKIVDCYFSGWFGTIDVTDQGGSTQTTNLEIAYNTVEDSRCDVFRVYQRLVNCRIHHNWVKNTNLHLAWQKDANRHPDFVQFALTGSRTGSDSVVIEDNLLQSLQVNTDYHGVFLFAESVYRSPFKDLIQTGHKNITIRRNLIQGGNTQGVAIGGARLVMVRDNKLLRAPGNSTTDFHTPQVYFIRNSGGDYAYQDIQVLNNAWALSEGQSSLKFGTGPRSGNTTITGSYPVNVTPSTGNGTNLDAAASDPVGWSGFDVALGRVGQYAAR